MATRILLVLALMIGASHLASYLLGQVGPPNLAQRLKVTEAQAAITKQIKDGTPADNGEITVGGVDHKVRLDDNTAGACVDKDMNNMKLIAWDIKLNPVMIYLSGTWQLITDWKKDGKTARARIVVTDADGTYKRDIKDFGSFTTQKDDLILTAFDVAAQDLLITERLAVEIETTTDNTN